MKTHTTESKQKQAVVQLLKKFWRLPSYLFSIPTPKVAEGQADLDTLLTQSRDRMLTYMLRTASILSILVVLYLMGDMLARKQWEIVVVYLIVAVSIGLIGYLSTIHYKARALTFLSIVYLLGCIDLALFGVAEDWRLYLSTFAILATVFLGWRAGITAIFLSLGAFLTIAWQIAQKSIVITASTLGSPIPNTENLIAMSLAFLLTNSIVITAVSTLLNEFENATKKERQTAVSLRQKTTELEDSLNREQELGRKLALALQQEEELSQLRANIITTVSHEFRTPLTIINNSTNLLGKYYDRLSEEKREAHYKSIHSSIFYLNDLLQDVSLVEHTKKDEIQFQPALIRFGALCDQLLADLLRQTSQPANVHLQTSGDLEKMLTIDYRLLKRTAVNLLTNALKFSSPESHIDIRLHVDDALTLSVIDQGIGIPAADKEKIYGLFQRGSNVETRSGLGLGLFIVQHLVETMFGTIKITDNFQGQGTIVTVQLPISPID